MLTTPVDKKYHALVNRPTRWIRLRPGSWLFYILWGSARVQGARLSSQVRLTGLDLTGSGSGTPEPLTELYL